jgi:polar amino acid transport system permease protein
MDFGAVWDSRTIFLEGFVTTLELAAIAIACGTVLGLVCALLRAARLPVVGWIVQVYVLLFRGTPLLLQLFFIYFVLPVVGVEIDMFTTVTIGLTLYSGAYVTEIIRAGIEAVAKGQRDAGLSLGMSFSQLMRHVVLPQAGLVTLPVLVGWWIGVVKDTTLATIIGYKELLFNAQEVIDRTGAAPAVYLTVAILYFAICFPLSRVVKRLERLAAVGLS